MESVLRKKSNSNNNNNNNNNNNSNTILEGDQYWLNQAFKNSSSLYRTHRFNAGITLVPPLSQNNLCRITRAASSRYILTSFVGVLQCFATRVSHNTVRGSVRNCQINKSRLRNSEKNYKYTSKYRANLCTAVGNTANVSVRYHLPLGFLFVFVYGLGGEGECSSWCEKLYKVVRIWPGLICV